MPHTAVKTVTVAMYFGQLVVNLREFLPDEAIPPIKIMMGDPWRGASSSGVQVPRFNAKQELFDDSVTIMARIRLARIVPIPSHEAAKGYFRDEARCA
jgi:hypothetical protein